MMTVNLEGAVSDVAGVLSEFRKCGGGAIVEYWVRAWAVAVKDRAAYCGVEKAE